MYRHSLVFSSHGKLFFRLKKAIACDRSPGASDHSPHVCAAPHGAA